MVEAAESEIAKEARLHPTETFQNAHVSQRSQMDINVVLGENEILFLL